MLSPCASDQHAHKGLLQPPSLSASPLCIITAQPLALSALTNGSEGNTTVRLLDSA